MRAVLLLVIVCQLFVGLLPTSVTAQEDDDCDFGFELSYHACRSFDSASGLQRLSFDVYWVEEGESQAREMLFGMAGVIATGGLESVELYDNDFPFGENRVVSSYDFGVDGVQLVTVIMQLGEFLAVWTSAGTAADPLSPLRDYYEQFVQPPSRLSVAEQFHQLLPENVELPDYNLVAEDFSSAPDFAETAPTNELGQDAPEPSGDLSDEDIHATVAALAESVPDGSINDPTAIPKDTLQVSNLSSRDAGVGDGTIYIYADVENGTSQVYSFVTLTATCKDTTGRTVGTGNGIAQNVGPGDAVTVTIIIVTVPTCDKINVRIDSAY